MTGLLTVLAYIIETTKGATRDHVVAAMRAELDLLTGKATPIQLDYNGKIIPSNMPSITAEEVAYGLNDGKVKAVKSYLDRTAQFIDGKTVRYSLVDAKNKVEDSFFKLGLKFKGYT